MILFKAINYFILYSLYFTTNVQGYYDETLYYETTEMNTAENPSDVGREGWPGYKFFPNIQGFLKLHKEPTDWHTARMNCHDEDAVLAAPVNNDFHLLLRQMLSLLFLHLPSEIYLGVHAEYTEGVHENKNGRQVLSLDPADSDNLDHCGAYFANQTAVAWVNCRMRLPYVCHAPAASLCGTIPGYKLNEVIGTCYKFHSQSLPWNEAHSTCLAEGAHLAIPNSDVEAKEMVDLFAKYPFKALNGTNPAWGVMAVGFYYWKNADKYITIHGQTLEEAGYAKWSSGNPSSRGSSKELGGGMFRSGLLDDVDKSYQVPFICEKKPYGLLPYYNIGCTDCKLGEAQTRRSYNSSPGRDAMRRWDV